jgi:hypothetical protein
MQWRMKVSAIGVLGAGRRSVVEETRMMDAAGRLSTRS